MVLLKMRANLALVANSIYDARASARNLTEIFLEKIERKSVNLMPERLFWKCLFWKCFENVSVIFDVLSKA